MVAASNEKTAIPWSRPTSCRWQLRIRTSGAHTQVAGIRLSILGGSAAWRKARAAQRRYIKPQSAVPAVLAAIGTYRARTPQVFRRETALKGLGAEHRNSSGDKLRAWLALSRPPFHSVGLFPFILGAIVARKETGLLRWDILGWGALGVILTMLATYYAGEYWDFAEDTLSGHEGNSPFAGGSQVVQRGLLSRRAPLIASVLSLLLGLGVAIVLQGVYRTGPLTLAMSAIGMLGGFFYSTRPLRWVSTGAGELWIGFCYGWLPVAAGYYLQTGHISLLVHWIALPIAFTIFNVILLNEFPDYTADREVGKRNLTVRLGPRRAAWLYAAASVAGWLAMWTSIRKGVPAVALWFYLPVLCLSWMLTVQVLGGSWKDRLILNRLCAMNIAVNLGTCGAYLVAYLS